MHPLRATACGLPARLRTPQTDLIVLLFRLHAFARGELKSGLISQGHAVGYVAKDRQNSRRSAHQYIL